MSIGYLGPAGSWTHQACLDLYADQQLVPLACDDLFKSYSSGQCAYICVPVISSVVGITPYMDAVLSLPEVVIVAEYSKMLGYSLLAKHGTRLEEVTQVLAHPVAFEEVKPWIDQQMPHVRRLEAASGGAAAQAVANSLTWDKAAFGPKVGATVYGLVSLADGIEEGPHNVTRWWVLGRTIPNPTAFDKTAIIARMSDAQLELLRRALSRADIQIFSVYKRPSSHSLDGCCYLIELAGHALEGRLADFLGRHAFLRVLGSYACQ